MTNKILYVEDEDVIRKMFVRILGKYYNLMEAKNGVIALAQYDIYRTKGLDLILTDIDIPEMNGIDLTRRIRSYKDQIPIIVMSGGDHEMQARLAGASAYLEKPCDINKVLHTIDYHLKLMESKK